MVIKERNRKVAPIGLIFNPFKAADLQQDFDECSNLFPSIQAIFLKCVKKAVSMLTKQLISTNSFQNRKCFSIWQDRAVLANP